MRRLAAAFALLVAMIACVGPSTTAEAPRATTEPTGPTMADGD